MSKPTNPADGTSLVDAARVERIAAAIEAHGEAESEPGYNRWRCACGEVIATGRKAWAMAALRAHQACAVVVVLDGDAELSSLRAEVERPDCECAMTRKPGAHAPDCDNGSKCGEPWNCPGWPLTPPTPTVVNPDAIGDPARSPIVALPPGAASLIALPDGDE
jgi:hypothetical protein